MGTRIYVTEGPYKVAVYGHTLTDGSDTYDVHIMSTSREHVSKYRFCGALNETEAIKCADTIHAAFILASGLI